MNAPIRRPTRSAPTVGFHRTMFVLRITLLATLWVVGGCSASSGGSDSPPPSRDTASLTPASGQPSQLPGASPGSFGPIALPSAYVEPVVAEIARLTGVPVDQVVVRSGEAVTFPDGGLGCPMPGVVYIQVQVEGYKLVAEAGGATFDYRGTGPGRFRLCTKTGG